MRRPDPLRDGNRLCSEYHKKESSTIKTPNKDEDSGKKIARGDEALKAARRGVRKLTRGRFLRDSNGRNDHERRNQQDHEGESPLQKGEVGEFR